MPLKIIRDDITKVTADAIVNATNSVLRPSGGADMAIHRAAGPELQRAVRKIGRLSPGQAAATKGFSLPCRYILHTVGPGWFDRNSRELLDACYQSCLSLAFQLECRSVAFPLIASGELGFPKEQALYIAVDAIRRFLAQTDLDVTLVVFDQESFHITRSRFQDIQVFIDRNYADSHTFHRLSTRPPLPRSSQEDAWKSRAEDAKDACYDTCSSAPIQAPASKEGHPTPQARPSASPFSLPDLKDRVSHLDESFSQMLLRKIDESGMTDAQCYKKAYIDRKLFSKIRSDPQYRPSKITALSFAIALELSLDETRDLLRKAGFALSHSSKFDVIVEYFIQNGIYDFFQINEALFAYDQLLLGS